MSGIEARRTTSESAGLLVFNTLLPPTIPSSCRATQLVLNCGGVGAVPTRHLLFRIRPSRKQHRRSPFWRAPFLMDIALARVHNGRLRASRSFQVGGAIASGQQAKWVHAKR